MAPNERLLDIISSTSAWKAWNSHYAVELKGIGLPPYTCAEAILSPRLPDTIHSIRRQLSAMTHLEDVTLELMNLQLIEENISAALELQPREDNSVGVYFGPLPKETVSPYMESEFY